MSKNKKKVHTKKDEAQGRHVVKILFAVLIILGLLMIVGFSFFT